MVSNEFGQAIISMPEGVDEFRDRQVEEAYERTLAVDFTGVAYKVHQSKEFGGPVNETEVSKLLDGYRQMLALMIAYPGLKIVPTEAIDVVWHSHILDTRAYREDSTSLFGRFLDHNPYFGLGDQAPELETAGDATRQLAEHHFGDSNFTQSFTPRFNQCSSCASA
jgi:hypothetical protein